MAGVLVCGIAVVDHVYSVDTLPTRAQKHEAHAMDVIGGGCAANAAVAVARLGGAAQLLTRLGDDDTGQLIRSELEDEGVDMGPTVVTPGARSPVSSVFVDAAGERMIMSFRGTRLADDAPIPPLPEAVLARAQALLGPEGERLERLLEALEEQREQLADARADAEREAGEARERAASLEAEIARLRAREDELLAEAAAKADAQLQATLQRATRLGKTAATDEGAGRSQALEEIRALRREAQRDAGRDRGRAPDGASGGGGAVPADPLVPGREVRVASYDAQGPITEVRGDRVWVQLGLLRVEVGRDEVELAPEPERVTHGGAAPDPSFGAGFDAELNVRGERAEAATEKVREFVLEAHALRVPTVRILHGKGTGALRDAVRETLRGEARVARYEDAVPYEGGHVVLHEVARSLAGDRGDRRLLVRVTVDEPDLTQQLLVEVQARGEDGFIARIGSFGDPLVTPAVRGALHAVTTWLERDAGLRVEARNY